MSITLLATRSDFSPIDILLGNFYLFKFDIKSNKLLSRIRVGKPFRIYYFPRTSGIVKFEGHFIVVWLDTKEHLHYSAWNPTLNTYKNRKIKDNVYWNTSISIANSGEKLLIAYHGWGNNDRSVIKTLLYDLE